MTITGSFDGVHHNAGSGSYTAGGHGDPDLDEGLGIVALLPDIHLALKSGLHLTQFVKRLNLTHTVSLVND